MLITFLWVLIIWVLIIWAWWGCCIHPMIALFKFKRVSTIVAWYDTWIGFYYDAKKDWLHIFPVPWQGIIIKFKL